MRIIAILFICSGLFSCDNSNHTNRIRPAYFDLKGFFEQESLRLNRINTPVFKTISRNGDRESKKVRVNWTIELALFTESDINKPAWRNSYKKISGPGKTEYIALENKLRTRKIEITRSAKQITAICIINHTSNFLYSSTESLAYYPDSAYSIEKQQAVKILGTNQFTVTGKFK